MSTLLEMFSSGFLLQEALYGSLLLGMVCPLAGIYLVLRRMVLFGIALPQISSAGIAFAYLLHTVGIHIFPHEDLERTTAMIGSLTFTFVAIIALVLVDQRGFTLNDAHIGSAYAVAAALSILFVSANPFGEREILSLLKGEVLGMLPNDLPLLIITASAVTLCLVIFQRFFTLVSFDPAMAMTMGKNVSGWNLFLFGLIGILVAHGVILVGPLMIFGFLVLPAVAAHQVAMLYAWDISKCSLLAAILGGISSLIGFYLSLRFDLPLGPTDVTTAFIVLLCTTLWTKSMRVKT
ncbi:MAG: hypothetical protein CMH81_05515 [Nitrospiraceae bacterium]|nr:hypothetical protein [Nitrospiraceae bacterium]|tara:strand:- start:194 stop:1072 length:879 start_codon:yes stop_codon:yes gene_type:complete